MSSTGTGTGSNHRRRHHRILVIGSTGAGKSTLINALVGYDAMHTSSDATGCTGEYSTVTTVRDGVAVSGAEQSEEIGIEQGGDDDSASSATTTKIKCVYEFIDTVGVNEPEDGTVSRADALKMFFKFLKDNKQGFNLIIFCTREGRLTEECKLTYKIMVEKLYSSSRKSSSGSSHTSSPSNNDSTDSNSTTKKKRTAPPVLIFVGGLFLEYASPQEWCETNRKTFLRQGFVEADPSRGAFHAVALPKSKNPALEQVFAETRKESAARAWTVIEHNVVPAPVELYTNIKGLMGLVQTMWNSIAKNFGWPLIIPEVLREIAKACGFSSRDISELTDHESLIFL